MSAVFFFQAEDGIRDYKVTGVQTCALPISIIAFGLFGFRLLPVSALPKVDFPTIAVTATLPGASADTMRSEERRVGKECRSRGGRSQKRTKKRTQRRVDRVDRTRED